jgi:hypothetical protein
MDLSGLKTGPPKAMAFKARVNFFRGRICSGGAGFIVRLLARPFGLYAQFFS